MVTNSVKNPFQFIEEVRQEVSKVTWPTWKEVWITTAMVLVMVALTSVFFLLTDMIISSVVQFVLRLGTSGRDAGSARSRAADGGARAKRRADE